MASLNEILILYDKGGALSPEARLLRPIATAIDAVRQVADLFAFLVLNRRPMTEREKAGDMPVIDVRPLSTADVRRLSARRPGRRG
jgi:hypothetical protein